MAKVKAGISNANTDNLISKGQTMFKMMSASPLYSGLAAQLAAFDRALDELVTANNDAKNIGGKLAHERKRASELKVRTMINDFAPQVQTLTGGDALKIVDSGWEVVRKPEHGEKPEMPVNFRALLTAYTSTIKLHWNGGKRNLYYQLEQLDSNGKWNVVVLTSRNRFVVEGLDSGKTYTYRLLAVGTAGASPYTDELTARAA